MFKIENIIGYLKGKNIFNGAKIYNLIWACFAHWFNVVHLLIQKITLNYFSIIFSLFLYFYTKHFPFIYSGDIIPALFLLSKLDF